MYENLLKQYEKDSEKLVNIIAGIRNDTIDDIMKLLSPCSSCDICEDKPYFETTCMKDVIWYEEIYKRLEEYKNEKL